MTNPWTREFDERMRLFGQRRGGSGVGLSVKVRVSSGCFHREHSPRAFEMIEQRLGSLPRSGFAGEYLEHESGPEILVWLAAGTAAATLVKSIVDLVVAILKARSEGIKKGDHPRDPLEVIVRRSVDRDSVKDELILRVGHEDNIDQSQLERLVDEAVRRLRDSGEPPEAAG